MAHSEMAVRHALTTGNDYTLGDSDGLTLNVTASGGKIRLFRYYWTGKQKRMSLGRLTDSLTLIVFASSSTKTTSQIIQQPSACFP